MADLQKTKKGKKSVSFDEHLTDSSPPPGMTEYRGMFLEQKHPMPSEGLPAPAVDRPQSGDSIVSGEFADHSRATFEDDHPKPKQRKKDASAAGDASDMKTLEEIVRNEDKEIRDTLLAEEKRLREAEETARRQRSENSARGRRLPQGQSRGREAKVNSIAGSPWF